LNPRTAIALRVLTGFALSLLWIAGAIVLASLSLMGTLMANDAGDVSASSQTRMVLLVLGGQILAGAAGVPLGLAVFWSSARKRLLRLFAILLAAGAFMIVIGIYAFVSELPAGTAAT
jgi:hypothetical protein